MKQESVVMIQQCEHENLEPKESKESDRFLMCISV